MNDSGRVLATDLDFVDRPISLERRSQGGVDTASSKIEYTGVFYRLSNKFPFAWKLRKFEIYQTRLVKTLDTQSLKDCDEPLEIISVHFKQGNNAAISAASRDVKSAASLVMVDLLSMSQMEVVFDSTTEAANFVASVGRVCRQSNCKVYVSANIL